MKTSELPTQFMSRVNETMFKRNNDMQLKNKYIQLRENARVANNKNYLQPKLFDLNMLSRIQEEEQAKREQMLKIKKQEFIQNFNFSYVNNPFTNFSNLGAMASNNNNTVNETYQLIQKNPSYKRNY